MNKELDTSKNLNYSFIAIPTNLFYCLDNNLRIGLSALIQLSSVFADADGWFFRTNEDLQNDFKLGKNLVIAVLETLFQNNLLQVKSVGFRKGVRKVNFYRVNFQAFTEFEQFNLYTISRCKELQIETVNYKATDFKVTYTAITDSFQVDEANNNTSNNNEVNASQTAGNAPTSASIGESRQPSSNAEEKPSEAQEIAHESDDKNILSQAESGDTNQEIEEKSQLENVETSQVVSDNNNQLENVESSQVESGDTNQPQSNEDKDNWDWIREIIEDSNEEVRAYVESYSKTAGNAPSSPSNNEGGQLSSDEETKPSEGQQMVNTETIETASVVPSNVEVRSYNGARLNPKLGENYNIMLNNIINDLAEYCDSTSCKLDAKDRKYLDNLIIRYCKQTLPEMENSRIGYEFKEFVDQHDIDYSDVHAYCDAFGRIVEVFGMFKSNIPF